VAVAVEVTSAVVAVVVDLFLAALQALLVHQALRVVVMPVDLVVMALLLVGHIILAQAVVVVEAHRM
jgi:hypothetical protein